MTEDKSSRDISSSEEYDEDDDWDDWFIWDETVDTSNINQKNIRKAIDDRNNKRIK